MAFGQHCDNRVIGVDDTPFGLEARITDLEPDAGQARFGRRNSVELALYVVSYFLRSDVRVKATANIHHAASSKRRGPFTAAYFSQIELDGGIQVGERGVTILQLVPLVGQRL